MKLQLGLPALALCLAFTLSGCNILDDILGPGPGHKPHPHQPELVCEPSGIATLAPFKLIDVMIDPYRSKSVAVEGDVLCAEVEYGGGCADHEFHLIVDSDVVEGNPVQLRAMITHNSNQDQCDALITKKVGFNLDPLKEHIREVTGQESGVITIQVFGGYDNQHTVQYNY